ATDLHRVANSRKAFAGQYQGLLDPKVLEAKAGQEQELLDKVNDGVGSTIRGIGPISAIETAQAGYRTFEKDQGLIETGHAIDASTDLMIVLARAVDAESRRLRKRFEEEIEEPERQAYAELANLRFKAFGKSIAPDATFTLRLAYGTVKGYQVGGEMLPFHTTLGGAFERSAQLGGKEPFDLPKRWRDGKDKLDLATPF